MGPEAAMGVEAFSVGMEGTLLCLQVPRLGIKIVMVDPVIIQPRTHLSSRWQMSSSCCFFTTAVPGTCSAPLAASAHTVAS